MAENEPKKKKPRKKKAVEDVYKKLTQLEHVLIRPDTYIGSIELQKQKLWIVKEEIAKINEKEIMTPRMIEQEIEYVPGLYKIFDEILVNAADNKQRDETMKYIDIKWNQEEGWISVENDGRGIPICMHKEHNIYVPELIFGNLLTSSNYDDTEDKTTGGRNGFGAKLCNIFSKKFTIETIDTERKKEYRQTWKNNMTKKGAPKVKVTKAKRDKTKVTFWPDFERFHLEGLTDDIIHLLRKRSYDLAGTTPKDLKVKLNGKPLKVKDFRSYVDLYLKDSTMKVLHEKIGDRWEIVVGAQESGHLKQVSHVNNIWTIKGGKHVDAIAQQIASRVVDSTKSKNKGATIKVGQVKSYMFLFINCIIVNPAFDSQTKETLKTTVSKFGSKCTLSDGFIKKCLKKDFGLIEKVLAWAKFKQNRLLKNQNGKKTKKLMGIDKLDDANDAGGKFSQHCTLILTEGDSAKSLAVSGLSVIGRDRYGVFPLKGKMINVRVAGQKQLSKNTEVMNLKKIIGLRHDIDYGEERNFKSLRYGHIMIMTDQDHDGSHIKGLLINFFHHYWPSLLKRQGFLKEFITPIVVAKKKKQAKTFYTIPEYEEWKNDGPGGERKGWTIKYYKGLGTSTAAEGKKYFTALQRHKIDFQYNGEDDDKAIALAFCKTKADERKQWLGNFQDGTYLEQDVDVINYSDFVNKELILFSIADCARSIPSLVDGWKPGQRKILFTCFCRKLTKDLKVAQLAGSVSERACYHHGEMSLVGTIVGMAQNFVGSNNINVLHPQGQFGTRHMGGKDSASARYIYTRLCPVAREVFHKDDDLVLQYLDDDGKMVEPKYYVPVLPMCLVNGAEGIGTGWATFVPNYNPIDIIENLRRMLRDEEPEEMIPWYKGWEGRMTWDDTKANYEMKGKVEILSIEEKRVRIHELPIRVWTENYKKKLEELMVKEQIVDIRAHHTDTAVDFEVEFGENFPWAQYEAAFESGIIPVSFWKAMKLTRTMSLNNMVLFDENGSLKRYASATEILKTFYNIRLDYYGRRKEALIKVLKEELERLSNRARFILMVVKKELELRNRQKRKICEDLHEHNFTMFFRPLRKPGVHGAASNEEDENNTEPLELEKKIMVGYSYLLNMAIHSLTKEMVEKLLKERDNKKSELDELQATPIKHIWRNDLDKVEEAFKGMCEEEKEKAIADKALIDKKKAKAAAKNRRGKGRGRGVKRKKKHEDKKKDDESDDEDDYIIPRKKLKKTARGTGKRKAPAKKKAKAKAKQPSMKDFLQKNIEKEKEANIKKRQQDLSQKYGFSFLDSDSDDEEDLSSYLNQRRSITSKSSQDSKDSPPQQKENKAPKKKKQIVKKKIQKKEKKVVNKKKIKPVAANSLSRSPSPEEFCSFPKTHILKKRKLIIEDDDSDSDDFQPKKKRKLNLFKDSDDDDDEDLQDIVSVPPVSSRPSRRKASQKKKYVFSESEDSEEEKFSEPDNPNDETFDAADEWNSDNDLMDSE